VGTRPGLPQKEIRSLEGRRANIRGLFKFGPNQKRKVIGKRILLLDDLSKSGQTLAELRRVLAEGGSGKVVPFAFTEAGGVRRKL
jgi:predicted amidophosphoribosyltransferase